MPYESDAETMELGLSGAKLSYFFAITQIASVVISGGMVILIARMLGPASYGIYTLAYTVATFFSSFGVLGVMDYINKYIPHLQAKRKKKELHAVWRPALRDYNKFPPLL